MYLYNINMPFVPISRSFYELPIPEPLMKAEYSAELWHEQLTKKYFFGNQILLYNCFLAIQNKKVYVNFDTRDPVSRAYLDFILMTLPKKINDTKKEHFYYKKDV